MTARAIDLLSSAGRSKKVLLILTAGVFAVCFSVLINSFMVCRQYMHFLVDSEARTFMELLHENYQKTRDIDAALGMFSDGFKAHTASGVRDDINVIFFELLQDGGRIIYSSDRQLIDLPPAGYLTKKVFAVAQRAEAEHEIEIIFTKDKRGRLVAALAETFDYMGRSFGVVEKIDFIKIFAFFSISSILFLILGLALLFWGFSLVVRPIIRALIKAKDAALDAAKAKSQFLSNMSHEIRTPMNAIIGMTKIAQNTTDFKKIKSCLSRVEEASSHLLSLINDILDFSKIEADKIILQKEEFDLEKTLLGVANLLCVKADEKRQNFFVKIEPGVPRQVIGDSTRLGQVVMNLLSNAIKFTPEEGRVTLRVSVKERQGRSIVLEVLVQDNGIGMTPEQIKNMFQIFEQADNTITKRYGGTGLGLAICKKIVELMGGTIGVQSVLGEGSTFNFTAPLTAAADPLPFKEERLFDKSFMSVLVVDDSAEIRDYISSILTLHKIHNQTAPGGEKAVEMARAAASRGAPYRIVFMDLRMEGMDGLEAARRIKELGEKDTVVIMMSMYEMDKIEAAARQIGVERFLAKPIFPSEIINIINAIVGARTPARRKAEHKTVNFEGKNILVAEDVEVNREILQALLGPTKANVFIAADGKQALDMFVENPEKYDIILMDVQMPVMDGYTAARKIRRSRAPRAKEVPIIALTANAFKEDIDNSLAAGMNGHLTKPIEEYNLFAELAKHLGVPAARAAAPAAKTKALSPKADNLKGLDIRRGLNMLNNNASLYLRLLQNFVSNDLPGEFLCALERGDKEEALLKAHASKGVSANLCLYELYDIFTVLDAELRKGDMPDIESKEVQTLRAAYKAVRQSVQYLSDNPAALGQYKD